MTNTYNLSLESISIDVPQSANPTTTPDDLIRSYIDDCEIKGMAAESIRRYISSIKIFIQYLDNNGLNLLDADRNVLRNFIDYLRKVRKISYNTLKNYFSALTTFYEFLEFEGYINKNQVPSIRSRYVRRLKDNYEGQMRKLISIEEMAKLINSTLDIRDKAVITLLDQLFMNFILSSR